VSLAKLLKLITKINLVFKHIGSGKNKITSNKRRSAISFTYEKTRSISMLLALFSALASFCLYRSLHVKQGYNDSAQH